MKTGYLIWDTLMREFRPQVYRMRVSAEEALLDDPQYCDREKAARYLRVMRFSATYLRKVEV